MTVLEGVHAGVHCEPVAEVGRRHLLIVALAVLATLCLLRGAAAISLGALTQRHEQYSTRSLLRKFESSARKRNQAMLARANVHERVVIKINDVVFTPELRNRVVAEFAFCPVGSVLFAATNYGTVADDRLTPWVQIDDPTGISAR